MRGDEAALAAITHRAYQHGYEQALAVLKTQVENATARARAYEPALQAAEAALKLALADLDEARDKINERDALLVRVEAACEYVVGNTTPKGSLHALGKYDLATHLLGILTDQKSI